MPCIADANVIFALLVGSHPHHEWARRWWEQRSDGSVGLHLLVRMAVLRLLSNRIAMNGAPASPIDALKAWRSLADDPRCFAATPAASHEALFKALVAARAPSPNLWTDAWLVALAQSLDCELVTFDRGFRSFTGLKLQLLATGSRE